VRVKDHLTSFGGLAALSLDALSSVAYRSEVIVLVLAAAGTSALRLPLPFTPAIAGLLVVLVVSYCQVMIMTHFHQGSSPVGSRSWEHRTWCASTPESSAPAPSRKQPTREGLVTADDYPASGCAARDDQGW
jgi:hypothetical protein